MNGHLDFAVFLISKGATPDAKSDFGYTPLYIASEKNHLEMVKLLIRNNAGVNQKTKNGWTPLHIAAKENNRDIVDVLINKGADINAKNIDGSTPLHIAVEKRIKKSWSFSFSDMLTSMQKIIMGGHLCALQRKKISGISRTCCGKTGELSKQITRPFYSFRVLHGIIKKSSPSSGHSSKSFGNVIEISFSSFFVSLHESISPCNDYFLFDSSRTSLTTRLTSSGSRANAFSSPFSRTSMARANGRIRSAR